MRALVTLILDLTLLVIAIAAALAVVDIVRGHDDRRQIEIIQQ